MIFVLSPAKALPGCVTVAHGPSCYRELISVSVSLQAPTAPAYLAAKLRQAALSQAPKGRKG